MKEPLARDIIFALIPLIGLLAVIELAGRVVYFNLQSQQPTAVQTAFKAAKLTYLRWQAQRQVGEFPPLEALLTPAAAPLLQEFQQKYESTFDQLVQAVRKQQAKLVLLYIPTPQSQDPAIQEYSRSYFKTLAETHNVDLIDVSDLMNSYPQEVVTLLPENWHISRFGNYLIAQHLAVYMQQNAHSSSPSAFTERPRRLGDLKPNQNWIWTTDGRLPHRVITNNQGLRMAQDLIFPKQKQRLLFLGDSLTYGPHVNNQDTYPAQLQRLLPDREVINAGVAGYTITDQQSLFEERARFTEPDIVIVQVGDNDMYGLFYFKQNHFDRTGAIHQPSNLEKEFLELWRSKQSVNKR